MTPGGRLHEGPAFIEQVVAGIGADGRGALDMRQRELGERVVDIVVARPVLEGGAEAMLGRVDAEPRHEMPHGVVRQHPAARWGGEHVAAAGTVPLDALGAADLEAALRGADRWHVDRAARLYWRGVPTMLAEPEGHDPPAFADGWALRL